MKTISLLARIILLVLVVAGCDKNDDRKQKRIKELPAEQLTQQAKAIESQVTPQVDPGLTLKIWGVDSLVADPVSIDIDDHGALYYTRTNRQKNSEFDIRGHQDWEIESMSLKNIEEKRA